MRHLAAYLLANLGGNSNPSSEDISKILKSVGISFDASLSEKIVNELSGKAVDNVINSGLSKMSSVSVSGSASAPTAPLSQASASSAPEANKKQTKEEDTKEESDADIGLSLFD